MTLQTCTCINWLGVSGDHNAASLLTLSWISRRRSLGDWHITLSIVPTGKQVLRRWLNLLCRRNGQRSENEFRFITGASRTAPHPSPTSCSEFHHRGLLRSFPTAINLSTHTSLCLSPSLSFSLSLFRVWISLFVVRETHFSIYWSRSWRNFQFHRAWKLRQRLNMKDSIVSLKFGQLVQLKTTKFGCALSLEKYFF